MSITSGRPSPSALSHIGSKQPLFILRAGERIKTAPVACQLGRLLFLLLRSVYLSGDCFLCQSNHRPSRCRRRWLRDAIALPPVKGEEGAMNAIIYPVHFHRNFERLWEKRVAGLVPRHSPSEGTDTCGQGNVIGACGDLGTRQQASLLSAVRGRR